jgi:hypothetical protein
MKLAALVLTLCVLAPAAADGKGKPRRSTPRVAPELPRPQPAPLPADANVKIEPKPEVKPAPARPPRTKVYTFTGLDVDGKLKTPQLLYFFDRVKLELDTTAQPKRSFIKELEATSSDKGL